MCMNIYFDSSICSGHSEIFVYEKHVILSIMNYFYLKLEFDNYYQYKYILNL